MHYFNTALSHNKLWKTRLESEETRTLNKVFWNYSTPSFFLVQHKPLMTILHPELYLLPVPSAPLVFTLFLPGLWTWIILFDQMLHRGSQERTDWCSNSNAERVVQFNADLLNTLNILIVQMWIICSYCFTVNSMCLNIQ